MDQTSKFSDQQGRPGGCSEALGRRLALSSSVRGGRWREGELGGGSLGGIGRNGLAATAQLLELAAAVKEGGTGPRRKK